MDSKLINKFLIVIIITIGIYAGFLLISDFNAVYNKITNFKIIYLPPILALISCSWLILFIRWTLLLKNLKISIPIKDSFMIYLSSFSLSATPGQLGELIKSQILKNKFDIPITKTAPLVFIERLYDLTGALIVSMLGIWFLGVGIYIIIVVSVLLSLIYVILKSQITFNKILSFLNNIKFLKKTTDTVSNSYEIIQSSISGKLLAASITLSVLYWLVIGIVAYLVIIALGIDILNYLNVISIYSSSLILGAATFIPGGIGVTEGSIAGLLTLSGIDIQIAFAIGILIRIFTLWYSVLIGFIVLKISGGLTDS